MVASGNLSKQDGSIAKICSERRSYSCTCTMHNNERVERIAYLESCRLEKYQYLSALRCGLAAQVPIGILQQSSVDHGANLEELVLRDKVSRLRYRCVLCPMAAQTAALQLGPNPAQ